MGNRLTEPEVPAENRKAEGKAGSTPAIFISKKYPRGTPPYKQGDWLDPPTDLGGGQSEWRAWTPSGCLFLGETRDCFHQSLVVVDRDLQLSKSAGETA